MQSTRNAKWKLRCVDASHHKDAAGSAGCFGAEVGATVAVAGVGIVTRAGAGGLGASGERSEGTITDPVGVATGSCRKTGTVATSGGSVAVGSATLAGEDSSAVGRGGVTAG